MNRITYYLSWVVLSATMILTLLFTFWITYPYKTVEFKNSPFEVKTPIVKVGGHIEYEVDMCKYVAYGGKLSRTFIDGVVYATSDIETNAEKGCYKRVISVYIPRALPEGTYTIKTNYRYQVNPIRTIDVVTHTQPFTIVK